jgi:predicted nucleic acid-binding Zn ribbon protein
VRTEKSKAKAKGPERIGDILTQLMARRGYARVQSGEMYDAAWHEAAGPLAAKYSRVGSLKRGTLEVVVANSALVQEFTFQKTAILKTLNEQLPDQGIKDLRFRVGAIQ